MANYDNLRSRMTGGKTCPGNSASNLHESELNNVGAIVEEIAGKRNLAISAKEVRREIGELFRGNENDGVETSSCKLSLIDPISKMRIKIPIRSVECSHFQCFDLRSFLDFHMQNQDRNIAWICPLCKSSAQQNQLRIDEYFEQILGSVGVEPFEVELLPNGDWREVEQLDSKEVPRGDLEASEISEIVPKKKAKIQGENLTNPTTEGVFASKENIILKKLREILGITTDGERGNQEVIEAVSRLKTLESLLELSDGESVIAAVEKWKQQKEITSNEHRSLSAIINCPDPEESGGGAPLSGEKAATSSSSQSLIKQEPREVESPHIVVENNNPPGIRAIDNTVECVYPQPKMIDLFWVRITWTGQPPADGYCSPFQRGQKRAERELANFVRECTNIQYSKFGFKCTNMLTEFGNGFARVSFLSETEAKLAVEKLTGCIHYGCTLKASLDEKTQEKFPKEHCVVRFNLKSYSEKVPSLRGNELLKAFCEQKLGAGSVVDVCKGCQVTFRTDELADAAIARLNGEIVDGHKLTVKRFALSKAMRKQQQQQLDAVKAVERAAQWELRQLQQQKETDKLRQNNNKNKNETD